MRRRIRVISATSSPTARRCRSPMSSTPSSALRRCTGCRITRPSSPACIARWRPGGRFVAQCGGGPNLERLFSRAADLMRDPAFAAHFTAWERPWEFADVPTTMMRLERAGFARCEVTLEPAPAVFAGPRQLRRVHRPHQPAAAPGVSAGRGPAGIRRRPDRSGRGRIPIRSRWTTGA